MQAMAYATDQDGTLEFTAVLWRFMQGYRETPLSRKEMAGLLTGVGFRASENNVSQWLNGDRTPPPGVPYYAALALDLSEGDSHFLAWSYSWTYKDNRKGSGRSGKNVVSPGTTPTEPGLVHGAATEEHLDAVLDHEDELRTRRNAEVEPEGNGAGDKPA